MGRAVNVEITERERLTGEVLNVRTSLAFHQGEVDRLTARVVDAEKALADFNERERDAYRDAAGFTTGM